MVNTIQAQIQPVLSHMHRYKVTPKELTQKLRIGEDVAGETPHMTTERAVRVKVDNLARRFRTRQAQK